RRRGGAICVGADFPSTVAVQRGSNDAFNRTTAARAASTSPEKMPSEGDAEEVATDPGGAGGAWFRPSVGPAAGRPPNVTVGNIFSAIRPELRNEDICCPMFVRFAAIGAIVSTTSRYPMSSTCQSAYAPSLATSRAGTGGWGGARVMMYRAPNRS